VVIDLFESEDFMCSIKAHKSWLGDKRVKLSGEGAMFRLEGGRNYTGAEFNKDLRGLLKGVVDYSVSPVTSHGFRRGLATFMGKRWWEHLGVAILMDCLLLALLQVSTASTPWRA
jgi:hypothetical protein